MLTEIMPLVDYAVDFHAGGASRSCPSNSLACPNNPELITLAMSLMPHILFSKNVPVHLGTQAIN
jgi:predicted deacylase